MDPKTGAFVLVLAGIGLAGCSTTSAERPSDTAFKSSSSGASQPQPVQSSPVSAAGQTAAAQVGTPEAEKHEEAFRQLDTNHDGVIDRQEFGALKLVSP